jgi:hypothetical protein
MNGRSRNNKIFVSSTTAGLWNYRSMVGTVLQAQGFKAVIQEDAPFPPSTMHQVLQRELEGVVGMISLVGPFYGKAMPEQFPGQFDWNYSYTQYELAFALRTNRRTRIFFTGPDFQVGPLANGSIPSEPSDTMENQRDFREWIHRTFLDQGRNAGWRVFDNELQFAMELAKIDWRDFRACTECRNVR